MAQKYEPYKTADRTRRAEAEAANQAAVQEDALARPAAQVPVPDDAFERFVFGMIIVLTILRAINMTLLQHLISGLAN